jgi:hypothetical protein
LRSAEKAEVVHGRGPSSSAGIHELGARKSVLGCKMIT